MGSFAGFLGDAAKGYTQAAREDTQRQFEMEHDRRAAFTDLLGKLANDPTAHPETQQAALQGIVAVHAAPWNKPVKLEPIIHSLITRGPQQPTQMATTPGAQVGAPHDVSSLLPKGQPMPTPPASIDPGFNVMPAGAAVSHDPGFMRTPPAGANLNIDPGFTSGGPSAGAPSAGRAMPQLPQQAQFTPPPNMGMRYTPEEQAAQAAQRAGQVASAEAGAQMAQPVYQQQPGGGYGLVPVSHAGTQMAPAIPNVVSPYMMQGRGLRQVTYIDPATNQPMIGTHNLLTNEVMDQTGKVVPGAVPFESSLVTKGSTATESMAPSGAVTRQRTTGPVGGKGTGGGTAMPTPPGGGKPGSAVTRGTPGPNKLPTTPQDFQNIKDPVTREAYDWATLGKEPKGGAMAVRQVESKMNQLGLAKALPVPPAMQQKVQEMFRMRNSAISLIDDVMKNSRVLDSILSSGKIQLAISPSTGAAMVTRASGLNPQESQVAGDFQQLVEHANLLRGPLGATGFRGHEAWAALQAQRGNIMGDPRITRQALTGMRERLVSLNSADKMVLSGQGMNTGAAEPQVGGLKVGDVRRTKNGKQIKISAIHPDGSFDAEEVK